ncbi:hypothetical protein AB0E74_00750 [Streptomyces sp. NPDC030392]|uniref:hypothetical protein n=1 Tax=Streptomyces sp. NPDC030392 TaxID=3155468 RepID=UPI0033D0CD0F
MSVPLGPRLLRAAVFAAVCVVLSALGHSLAAGQAVPWWTLTVGFAGLVVLALPFTGRERSLPSITAALAGGQLALHTVFGIGQEHAAPTGTGGPASDALIRTAARFVCGGGAVKPITADEAHRIVTAAGLDPATAAGTAPIATGPVDQLILPSLSMVLAHLLAALPAGWLLRRGDLALLRLSRLAGLTARGALAAAEEALVRALRAALVLVGLLLAGARSLLAAGPRAARAREDGPRALAAGALQHTVIRRGPPASVALAA